MPVTAVRRSRRSVAAALLPGPAVSIRVEPRGARPGLLGMHSERSPHARSLLRTDPASPSVRAFPRLCQSSSAVSRFSRLRLGLPARLARDHPVCYEPSQPLFPSSCSDGPVLPFFSWLSRSTQRATNLWIIARSLNASDLARIPSSTTRSENRRQGPCPLRAGWRGAQRWIPCSYNHPRPRPTRSQLFVPSACVCHRPTLPGARARIPDRSRSGRKSG